MEPAAVSRRNKDVRILHVCARCGERRPNRVAAEDDGEQIAILDAGDDLKTHVIGPRNAKQSPPGDTACEIRVHVNKEARAISIETGGSPAKPVTHNIGRSVGESE